MSDSYIQRVPDKCDRIVWRGKYFHLPLEAMAPIGSCQINENGGVRAVEFEYAKDFETGMKKLLPETYNQAHQMTITPGAGVNAEEVGHWYSPACVARLIDEEREACAKICDNRAKQYSGKADETDDEKYHVYLKARAWECSVLACDIRKLAPNTQVNPAGEASPATEGSEGST